MLKKKKFVIEELKHMVSLLDNNKLIQDLSLKKQKMQEIGNKLDRLVKENSLKLKDQDVFQEEYNKLSEQYNKLRDECVSIEEAIEHNTYDKVRLETEIKSYQVAGFIKEFSEELWLGLLDKAVVYGDKIEFVWKK